MNSLQNVVNNTLGYLMELSKDEVRPPEAKNRLRFLQSQQPEIGLRLVWEEEPYDGSVHYDVLIRLDGQATVSLSYCSDRALPWPLRGVHRWAEVDLLRVNDIVLKVEQAIACLDFLWNEAPLVNRLVNVCLIQEELDKNPIELTDPELQLGMDGFRRAHKLYEVEDTHRWLQLRGMTHAQLERLVTDNLVIAKLRERITDGRVERYFEDHQADFDTAWIAQIYCESAISADQVYREVSANGASFHDAAQRRFLATAKAGSSEKHAHFAKLRRNETPGELAAKVFSACTDDIVGPARVDDGYVIARILCIASGQLDESTRSAIQSILFEEWLAKRRESAAISWSWGSSQGAS